MPSTPKREADTEAWQPFDARQRPELRVRRRAEIVAKGQVNGEGEREAGDGRGHAADGIGLPPRDENNPERGHEWRENQQA